MALTQASEGGLKISNAGTNGQFLQKSSNTGGLTWADVPASGIASLVADTSPQLGGDLDTNSFEISLDDDHKVKFGAGNDLQIYHSDTGNKSYITHSGAGAFEIYSSGDNTLIKSDEDVYLMTNGTENGVYVQKNGQVALYYDNVKKFETTSDGAQVTGKLFADNGFWCKDNDTYRCGDDTDMTIYHDGTHSYIKNITGNLYIQGVDEKWLYIQAKSGEDSIICKDDGAVELFYDNNKKAETVTGGFTVTGTCTATSFAGDGSNLTGISSGSTTDDQYNVKIGAGAGDDFSGTSANDNILIGKDAGTDITSADENVAIGTNALANSTTGSNNIAIGKDSSADMTNKGHCVAIGTRALKEAAGDQNIGIGTNTGYSLTSGEMNIAIGYDALYNGTTATGCVAIGRDAQKTTYGNPADYVVAIGHEALKVNQQDKTVGIGYQALKANSTGALNVAIGSAAGIANTSGGYNVAVGADALKANTTASHNVAVGTGALSTNTDGHTNTAIGRLALEDADGANYNTAVGGYALGNATSGFACTAVGVNALNVNTTGNYNEAFGYAALRNATGGENVAVGSNAALNTGAGIRNVAVGSSALLTNSTGQYNTAIGYRSLYENNSNYNTAIGHQAAYYMDTGEYNVAIGHEALRCASGTATHPDNNVAIGNSAMKSATEANECVVVGTGAAQDITTASETTAIGRYALQNVTTGGRNTAVGYNSMSDTQGGESNTCIGYEAGGTISSGNYNVCVGRLAGVNQITTGSDNLYIARSNGAAGTSGTWIYGNVSGECIQGDNSTSWSTTSDRRLKKNIVDSPKGLAEIDKLRVTNFEYRKEDEIDMSEFPLANSPNQICINDEFKEGVVQTGVIAQEVEAVLPECIKVNDKGAKTVSTDPIMWALVKAVQELSAKVTELEAK